MERGQKKPMESKRGLLDKFHNTPSLPFIIKASWLGL